VVSQAQTPPIVSPSLQPAYNSGQLIYVNQTPQGGQEGYSGVATPINPATGESSGTQQFIYAAAGPGAVLKSDANGQYLQATNGQQYRL